MTSTTRTYQNPAAITFTGHAGTYPGHADTYPSSIQVAGQVGPITDIDLSIVGIDMDELQSLNLLLVSPSGETEFAMSGNCNNRNVTGRSFTFDQQGANEMPAAYDGSNPGAPCPLASYRPSDGDPRDYPFDDVPGRPHTHNFNNFNNENANGRWTLYAASPYGDPADQIGGGWSIKIQTGPADLDLPAGTSSYGPAAPYPSVREVTGQTGLITDLNVRLDGVFHSHPDDIDMMLEGPGGQKVMLMSDACGSFDINAYGWLWDDEAPAMMPDDGTTDVCAATSHRPTDRQPGENLPAPAPAGPYSTSLSDFDLTDPNGAWRLWVADDGFGDDGFFTVPFALAVQTRPRAATSFATSNLTLPEGESGELAVVRKGAESYAAGTVLVTSTAKSASSGLDFAPVTATLEFAPGQTRRTVSVLALSDDITEGAEQFTIDLSQADGDAQLSMPSSVEVTIPSSAGASPQTRIDKGPKSSASRRATVRFSSSEAGSTFECRLDHVPFKPCRSPMRLTQLRPGKHAFRVRATDPAGNRDLSPASVRWRVRR